MDQSIIIKQATSKDIDCIYEILQEGFKHQGVLDKFCKTKETLEKLIFHDKLAEVLIAYKDKMPAGIAMFSVTNRHFDLFEKPGFYVHNLCVKESFYRLGIATALLNYIKMLAKERNLGRIDFVVLKNNLSAISFYNSFSEVEEVDTVKYMRIKIND